MSYNLYYVKSDLFQLFNSLSYYPSLKAKKALMLCSNFSEF